MMMLFRPGNGRYLSGSDSQVFLPITTDASLVTFAKCLSSSEICQGVLP